MQHVDKGFSDLLKVFFACDQHCILERNKLRELFRTA